MVKSFFLLVCFFFTGLIHADNPLSAQRLLPKIYTDQIVNQTASCVINSTNQMVFSWTNKKNNNPYYTVYDMSQKKAVKLQNIAAPFAFDAYRNVFCCYNSRDDQVFFTWVNLSAPSVPYYAIYDVNQKKVTQFEVLSLNHQAFPDSYCCYNSRDNLVFFSWASADPEREPFYAVYDANQKKVTQIEAIGSSLKVLNDVYCCYNIRDNLIFFSWTADDADQAPYYGIYNAEQKRIVKTEKIEIASSPGAYYDVFCSYNEQNNQVFFSWASYDQHRAPYFAVYDMNQQKIIKIQKVDAAYNLGVLNNVFNCYNSRDNQIAFSWTDNTGAQNPYYAIYDCENSNIDIKATSFINYTDGAHGLGVFCSYDPISQKTIFSWTSKLLGNNPWISNSSANLLLDNMQKHSQIYPQKKAI